ncbi:MAG TPA: cytochrome d ubiquinol oxidase subunit II [Solirubrobacterales bacterium]|nr:cytochrome d ubiquinol oxidase subunit II [Solirubrobacterales bacterium]
MHLYQLPLIFAIVGLALYTVLGGADFGAGFWQLIAGKGKSADELREHAQHAMAPVWEANHVWLIFVLTVVWTAYPAAFGSLASTLSIPLFIAGIGIILRGGAYALRAGAGPGREQRTLEIVFALSSILTPFALGTVIGGLASGRVHVGNPGGSLVTSWLNPTSIDVGVLAVASAAYTAAVFLSGDAERQGQHALAERFRLRALAAAVAAGAVAIAGLVVLHFDAERIFRRLTQGAALPALVASVLAGIATLALVWRRRYEPARYTAALAVAATIAGWALAQNPVFLRDLTVRQAAAPHDTQVAVVVAVLGGALILFPSLALLFRLTLGGRLGYGATSNEQLGSAGRARLRHRLGARLAAALFVAGVGLLTVADAAWAHGLGVTCFLGFIVSGYRAALPEDVINGGD